MHIVPQVSSTEVKLSAGWC